jgi:hypothetical protein
MPIPLIPDIALFQRKLAGFPLATYQAGECVLTAGSKTGRLLIVVVREGVQIAKVTEPGAVFGELSMLLDQPHTADLRALEASWFHVADAATLLSTGRNSRRAPLPATKRLLALTSSVSFR